MRHAARCPAAPAGLLAIAVAWFWLSPPAGALQDQGPDDARVRQAWSYLTPQEQQEAVAWFSAEVEWLDTLQKELRDRALALEQSDPGFLPPDVEVPFFDPKVHAPGQPIPRRRLAPDDERAEAVRQRILAAIPAPSFPSAWRYDWGSRQVLRAADFQAPEHVFELALAGALPGADLAQALVLRALDRGEQQLALGAFAHAYTDREGLVFPGLTLYDAWCSGTEIEMPDVDNLGIVHAVTGERGRWKAPIPTSQHDELYGLVGELFANARHYRGLREALATTYLVGTGPLRDGYPPHHLRLHGLWGEYSSVPANLAKVLPRSEDWADYLPRWAKRFDKDATRLAGARARVTRLDWDAMQVRAQLVRVLEELGAFERTSRPAPEPPRERVDPPAGGGGG